MTGVAGAKLQQPAGAAELHEDLILGRASQQAAVIVYSSGTRQFEVVEE